MKYYIDRLARLRGQGRQTIQRWRKKAKPFEDIIACLLGLTLGITVGAVLITGYSGHSSTGSFHRHHAEVVGSAPLASPVVWTRLERCPMTPTFPPFVA